MRESIGGAWLFGIVIVFISFFSAFLAYSVSYTRAFNVKNEIINYIEQNEGYTVHNGTTGNGDIYNADNESLDKSTQGKAFHLIKSVGYNYTLTQTINCDEGQNMPGGYCLVKVCPVHNDKVTNVHYKVTTYIAVELPVVGYTVKIPIAGETRSIYTDTSGYECTY